MIRGKQKPYTLISSAAVFTMMLAWLLITCDKPAKINKAALFESIPGEVSHIDFINKVEGDSELNIFNYRNFYNGGGVAIGDVNNDGLTDIFLISNMGDNKLFLNKGNFVFEDITATAGVGGTKAWSTGATLADVNGDGLLDIYVCNAGNRQNDDRSNELFINNGNLTFTDKAVSYGLDDKGFSTHAAFFDYDRDGDLDMYLLNNSFIPVGKLAYKNLRHQRDSLGGHKLFRNDGEHFTDISEQAGIFGSLISFGLGITIGDFDNDNWLDVYISNDFYERDYLYMNNHDGTFKEDIKNQMQHLSLSSMGADAADINNDGNLDIFVTDMLPGNDARMKMVSTFEGYDLYQLKKSRDYHNQIMQNTLQLNNGDNTFSEIARFSGVHATDWSWGALLFDMDNDGLKDIFVANGIYKDITDQDFVNFLVDENNLREFAYGKKFDFKEFQDKIASRPVPNYAFRNEGNMKFVNMAPVWGLGAPSFSNGAAYGDIDNDGDLDLVVNNVNQPVSIFRNTSSDSLKAHFLGVKLKGYAKNLHGIGTKVYISHQGKEQYLQEMPNRGFESSVDHTLIFGLGASQTTIDSLTVIWPDDKMQILTGVKSDQHLTLDHEQATLTWKQSIAKTAKVFNDITAQSGIDYKHVENDYVDYYKTPLLKQMYSRQGPALATGDVNNDGLDDVVFGGAKGQSPKLYIQSNNGKFTDHTPASFAGDTLADKVDALLFDADNDKDLDLYLVTGGSEFGFNDPALADKFFRNDGKGNFKLEDILPSIAGSGSCVVPGDFDHDGDLDLFVGGRIKSDQLGMSPPSYLYVNDGNSFKNYTKRYFADNELGMVTGAVWADLDHDNYPELLVVGDWMPVTIFRNEKGKGFKKIESKDLKYSSGWWNSIEAMDLNGDGEMDFVLGNLGENSRLKADSLHPVELYIKDFDNNGAIEQIITVYSDDNRNYPLALKHDLEKQLPFIKRRFIKYADYAGKRMTDIFKPEELKNVEIRKVFTGSTSLLINKGSYQFELRPLPPEAQYSPVMSTQTVDYDGDGILDIVLGGNFLDVLPEIGQYDANYGLILRGTGDFKYEPVHASETGFFVTGQVRKIRSLINSKKQTLLILGRNDDTAVIYEIKPTIRARRPQ